MGIEENWASYIELTRAKADSHGKVAQYWDSVHTVLNLIMIFFAAFTTLSTLLPISMYVPAGLGACTTLLSAVCGFMNPGQRRQYQMESSRAFRSLMLKMVRCETEREYEELWKEYNKELLGEPFLPKKYKVVAKTDFTMSPEFLILVKTKEAGVAEALEALSSGNTPGNTPDNPDNPDNSQGDGVESEQDDGDGKSDSKAETPLSDKEEETPPSDKEEEAPLSDKEEEAPLSSADNPDQVNVEIGDEGEDGEEPEGEDVRLLNQV